VFTGAALSAGEQVGHCSLWTTDLFDGFPIALLLRQ